MILNIIRINKYIENQANENMKQLKLQGKKKLYEKVNVFRIHDFT